MIVGPTFAFMWICSPLDLHRESAPIMPADLLPYVQSAVRICAFQWGQYTLCKYGSILAACTAQTQTVEGINSCWRENHLERPKFHNQLRNVWWFVIQIVATTIFVILTYQDDESATDGR